MTTGECNCEVDRQQRLATFTSSMRSDTRCSKFSVEVVCRKFPARR